MTLSSSLRNVRDAVKTPVAAASIRLWLRAAEEAVSNRNFGAAHERLLHAVIAINSADHAVDARSRAELATTLFEVSVRTGDPAKVRESTQSSARKWFLKSDANVESLLLDFAKLADRSNGFEISCALVDAFSTFGAPRFARAHYRHPRDSRARLEDYRTAFESFERHGEPLLASRAAARAAHWCFEYGEKLEGRIWAKRVNLEQLQWSERGWLAVSLAKSSSWLDHLRGIDLLEALYEEEARVADRMLTAEQIDVWSRGFLSRLPANLNDAVTDRLAEFSGGRDFAADVLAIRELIERQEGETLATLPVGRFLSEFPAFEHNFSEKQSPVGALYVGLSYDDDELADEAWRQICEQPLAYPFAALVADVLPWVARTERLVAETEQALTVFAASGRRPSFGWWQLSAVAWKNKFRSAATALTERALREGDDDPVLKAAMVQRSLRWVIEHAEDDASLARWLRVGKEVLD